jgi:signal transduction histidine kinase/HAMP domain-containing protein
MKAPGRGVSVQLKIIVLTVLILAAGMAISVTLTVTRERRDLLEAAQRTLSLNTEQMDATIDNLMLAGEAPVAVRAFAAYREIEGFLDIAVYRPDGTAAFSDLATIEKVNQYNPRMHFAPTPRVPATRLSDPNLARAVETGEPVQVELVKEKALEYFVPILMDEDCRVCHGYGGQVRGVEHLKISIAGIFGQIESAGRLLGSVGAAIGVTLAGLLLLMLNRTILWPVLAIGRVAKAVGGGNLDARVQVRSRDELGALGTTLNEMIEGLNERSQLIVRGRVIEARNAENRKYLDTIQEGLLLVDRDLVVGEQYSRFLEKILDARPIAGRSILDLLFPRAESQGAEREELRRFLDVLFTNTTADMDMIMTLNPIHDRALALKGDGSREIVLDARYHRIVQDGVIQNVMVILEDRTGLIQAQRELAEEKERSEEELVHIAAILKAGPETFKDFADQAETAVDQLTTDRSRLGARETADRLFRGMHSLKGAARYLEFGRIAHVTHEIEAIVASCRDQSREPGPEEARRLDALTASVRAEVGSIRQLAERFQRFAVSDTSAEKQYRELVISLKKMASEIASGLNKSVCLRAFGVLTDAGLIKKLRDPLIHLIRNAVDHGLEEELERIAAGKEKTGQISIVAARRDGSWMVRVTDDGRGIDFERVRQKAVTTGLLPETAKAVSRAELLSFLFSPRFSLAAKQTEISGRGVGLDAVQDVVQALGGRIFVASRLGEETSFTLRIPDPRLDN